MAIEISVHRVRAIRVATHDRSNANALKIEFQHVNTSNQSECLEIQTFDLPKGIAMKLLIAFGDDDTIDYAEKKAAKQKEQAA